MQKLNQSHVQNRRGLTRFDFKFTPGPQIAGVLQGIIGISIKGDVQAVTAGGQTLNLKASLIITHRDFDPLAGAVIANPKARCNRW